MHKNDFITFIKKHIKLSQALMKGQKEIVDPCVANDMLNPSPTRPCLGK